MAPISVQATKLHVALVKAEKVAYFVKYSHTQLLDKLIVLPGQALQVPAKENNGRREMRPGIFERAFGQRDPSEVAENVGWRGRRLV